MNFYCCVQTGPMQPRCWVSNKCFNSLICHGQQLLPYQCGVPADKPSWPGVQTGSLWDMLNTAPILLQLVSACYSWTEMNCSAQPLLL